MTETKPEKQSGLSTRGAVLAGVGVVLILALAFFIAAFVAPFLHTRAVVTRCHIHTFRPGGLPTLARPDPSWDPVFAAEEVKRLGGPRPALQRLSFYLHLPECLAPNRPIAARLLGNCGDRAVPELLRLLRDEDKNVRFRAAWALGEIGNPQAVEALIALLKDEGWKARLWAVWSLGEIGDPRAVEPLTAALKDEKHPMVRTTAAWALQRILDPKDTPPPPPD